MKFERPRGTFWVTRDEDTDGQPLDSVDVWTEQPVRFVAELDEYGKQTSAFWVTGEFDLGGRYAHLTVESARRVLPTLPDDSRQCIRYEG